VSEAQRAFLRDMMSGRLCNECGDPVTPGEDCETCAVKAVIVAALLDDQEQG
jgi:hypothetical protein